MAQWLAYALPCRRFALALTDSDARLGADVVRYSFIVVDLHHLLLAGLPAHAKRYPSPYAPKLMGIASLHPSYDRHTFAISRRIAPEVLHFVSLPRNREGAGKTGCALHPRSRVQSAQKETHTSIQVQSEALRHSPRNGFTAYFVLSPVNGFVATVAPEKLASQELDASTAASGPHDFVVRFSHTRQS